MEGNNEDKEHHFIYFIESHEKSREIRIYLSPNYNNSNTLEVIEEKDSSHIKNSLVSKIYRFKLIPDENDPNKKEEEVTVIMEDKLNKSQYIIKINDINKDFYEYNFYTNTFDIVKLSYEQQFELYVDLLRKKLKKLQDSKENEEFILSTQLLLENQKYDFLFYLLIFLECYRTKLGYKHLLSFKPEQIRGLGQVSDIKIKQISNILNMLYKKPEKIRIEKDKSIDDIKESFYFILLYFNLNFQKEKMNDLIDDDKIYGNIIKYQKFFNNIILPNNIVNKLIEKAKNFNQILNFLFYLGKDSVNVLETINDKKEKISKSIEDIDENNEKENDDDDDNKKEIIKIIEFEKYVLPKYDDNLSKIRDLIKDINDFEAKENNKLVKFTPRLIEQYIELNNNTNLANLRYINEIILSIKKVDLKFKLEKKLDMIIHDTALNLIENKKFNNLEILNFIANDDFYKNKAYNKTLMYRPLKVFDGIDIYKLDNDFFIKWKDMHFNEIFEYQFKEFSQKIASLINEMKDLEILFKLFNIEIDKEPPYEYIDALIKRFFELLDTYSEENCPKFEENVALLIFLIDKKKLKINEFLANIQNNLNRELINKIYIKTSDLYHQYLSKDTKNLIVSFFTKDKKNSEPLNLVYLIEKCKNLRKEIFSNIDKYIINENDFLLLEETDNYKFFKILVDKKILEEKTFDQISATYISKAKDIISSLRNKLEFYEINFGKLNGFFIKENDYKLKTLLMDKLLHIYLLDNEKAETIYNELKDKIKEIKIIILNLGEILRYFDYFFPNLYKNDISNIAVIIGQLNIDVLNSFENNYKNDYNKYIKFYDDAKERLKKRESKFFDEIFKEIKSDVRFKNDDIKCLEETEKTFNNFKKLFEKNGINRINKHLLEKCIKPIKDDEKALKKEINTLVEIFKIGDDASIDEKYNDILLMSKKEYIFNIARSINMFFKILNPIKTNFQDDIITITKSLFKSDIEELKKCKKILDGYNIDIYNKENIYIELLIMLNRIPESIKFLLETSIQECRNLQELTLENDNNFVSVNDILDMEKCIEFFAKIGQLKELKNKEDIEILNLIKKNASENKDILIYIKKYIENYNQIISLKGTLNKSEFLKYQIQALFYGAIFNLSNGRKESFTCIYFPKDKKDDEKRLNKENIIDLKERAQLSKKITSDYKCFIESVTKIINISNILENILMKGYPVIIKVEIKMNIIQKNIEQNDIKDEDKEYIIKNIYSLNNIQQNSYEDIIDYLNNILLELKQRQENAYETKTFIRYIYGSQFNLFYEHLKNIQDKNYNIQPLLKYITNDLYKNEIDNFKIEKKGNIIEDSINNCEKYLNELFNKNKLKLENIYQKTLVKKENYKGIFTYLCEKLEKELFQIFKYFTGNNPIAQNILLCNKYTTNEEITAFLYRAIKCKFNSCFIVGGIELLEFEQNSFIIKLLDQFFQKKDVNINSLLIFLYTTKSSDIYRSLEMKNYKDTLKIKPKDYEKIIYEENDIEIIKSDKSGVGKSTQIKKEIEENKKKYIYFPFGGVLIREDIIKRLKALTIDSNCTIHIDLYDTDQISLMMDFLFSMLITKCFGQNEDIFYLSKDVNIKIEIPNSFINFFEKFPILTLFKMKEIKITNLSPLIVPNNLDSNIQIVANYLKCLKEGKINDFDLIIPNVTPVGWEKRIITYKKTKKKINTSLKAIQLSSQECQKLIFDIIKETIPNPTYYQIISFVNILAVQLKKLNQNIYLNSYDLILSGKNINYIRTFIVESFIKLTKHFTEGAFTELLKKQENTHKSQFGIYDEGKDLNKAVNALANNKHEVLSFDKIDPSLLFFHEGCGESFSIITNKNPKDKEYIGLLNLKNSQAFSEKDKLKFLPKYNDPKFEKKNFLQELKDILDISNPIEGGSNSDKKPLKEIAGNYVITADNFVKMVLILLRIRSNIPVIMMGETGCGKTSLIRKLSELKNNGNADKMKILNIHAGTNDNDIIKFINEKVIPEAKIIEEQNKIEKEKRLKNNQLFEEVKIWVFLDEINTCKSMGLISELMCKHTCQGKPLPSNIVFIAACNPYRQRENIGNAEDKQVGLDINFANKQKNLLNDKEKEDIARSKNNNLVYTVNPLPHSLLNFVFDFGNLTEKDEEDYIRCIIKESIEKIYYGGKEKLKNEDKTILGLKQLAGDMIIAAHKFIREFSDKSAVSLREIRRFNIFYEFFYDYLKKRKSVILKENSIQLNVPDKEFYQNLNEYSFQVYSINLSIFICYYLRITNKKLRNTLVEKMNAIIQNFNKTNGLNIIKDFLELPLKEENFIANNIKVDKGIAKNRALLENIFSLFVAINNKVPIFIVGKPGCSKSLSFQLLNKSMQGQVSENEFFKQYPKLMINSYQGSMASTSKGVESIFSKARQVFQKLTEENKKNNISLIYFDEMGLAEHSPNNPLKVIHSELEYDQNEGDKKVAFVGISNWALDASKMNRGISISIPEPNEEDNKETSLTIGNSYDEDLAKNYKPFFENLGSTYFEYKQYLKEKHNADGKEDFHGNRDFYHLVKNASKNMIIKDNNHELNNNNLYELGVTSIERNFGGIHFDDEKKTSIEIVKNIFKEKYPEVYVTKEYDVLQRIKDNINDPTSRYLLIISKSSVSTFLLSSILNNENKEYSFYIGSKFKSDLNTEEYALKVLNKVQLHMENGNILIMKDLDSVYPAMYDLFNQNFTVLSNKNYARLAVGSSVNTFSFVNNNFRCIIDVDIKQIDNEEAPFLNRFEKHIMSFEYLLNKEQIRESENIKSKLDELVKYKEADFKGINYDLSKLLINCNIDEIQALLYKAVQNGKKEDEITDYILDKVSLTLPQDIIINMNCNANFKQKNKIFYNKILESYAKGEHTNFCAFLKTINNNKNVVYTFSNNLEKIKNINNINNPQLGLINENNIKDIIISSVKTENELEKQLDDFLNGNYKICLIHFKPFEGDFMNYIRYLIENKEKNYKNIEGKCFIFIVYMTRILKEEIKKFDTKTQKEKIEIKKKCLDETLTYSSDYYQIFIDNLNGEDNLKIEELIKMDNNNLFRVGIDFDKELISNLFISTSYMKYTIANPYKSIDRDNYIDKLIEFVSNNKRLKFLINECLLRQLSTNNKKNYIIEMLKQKNLLRGDEIDLLSVIKKYLLKIYASNLNLLFFKAEKDQFFSCLLTNNLEKPLWKDENKDITFIEKNAKIYLDKLQFDKKTKVVEKLGGNKVEIMLGLKIPGLKPVFDQILKSINENISKYYRRNENNLRVYLEDENEEIQNYLRLLKTYDNSTINIINKEQKLLNFIEDNKEEKEELYNYIINDYYTFFLNKNLNKKKEKKDEEGGEEEEEKEVVIKNFDDNKKYLDLMVKKRNEIIEIYTKENEDRNELDIVKNIIKKIAKNINFVESYPEEISSLQEIFSKLNMKTRNLYKQIEEIIEKKQIQYEISPRNPEYTQIVNESFFLCMDSLLRVIISNEKIYDIKDEGFAEDILYDLIHIYKEILQNALKLENNLTLRSKEVFSLQEILKIFDAFTVNHLVNIENFKKVIKYFGNETQLNNEKNEKELCNNLNTFYKFLVEILEKNKNFNYYKVLSFLFLNEFIKITFNKFREELFVKILNNNDFIKNSSQLFKIILENVIEINPQDMEGNLDAIKSEESPMFRKINNTNNSFLDEVIMNIFEGKISVFFEQIPELDGENMKNLYKKYYTDNQKSKIKNPTGIVFDNSLNIFKELIQFLDDLSKKKDDKEINKKENIHLCKLYSLAYIKMYLSKVVYFIKEKNKEMGSCKNIINIIKNIKNKKFEKVIKIYIFKLFYSYMNNNFEQFKNYNYKANGIDFTDEFEIFDILKDEVMLTHFFLPLDDNDYDKYQEVLKQFEIKRNIKFNSTTKEIAELIKKHGMNIFLDISINKIISNLGLKNYITDKDEYQNFSSFIKSLLETEYKIKDQSKKLLYLLYDDKTFMEKMNSKIMDENKNVNPQIFEMLLYGFKYCYNSLDNENNGKYLYKSLLQRDASEILEKSFIPGIDVKEDLHLDTLEIIKMHFETYQDSQGCYVCSCGYYYSIDPCGFPTRNRTSKCPVCQKDIGYGPKKVQGGASNHGMIIRPGHLRIFKDGKQKAGQMSRWKDPDENIPNITLDKYIKEIIEPIRKNCSFGFNPISRDFFENQKKKVRNLSNIGYRILNFISYCHLFYSYCLGYISEDNMKNNLVQNMTILKIIETDWNSLNESLQQKNIDSLPIFMNMIFKQLSQKIKECKYLTKSEDRDKFENDVEKLIEKCIANYPNYCKKYNEENKKQLELGNYNMKTIITEIVQPTEEIYPDLDYPMFKYFKLTKYKTEEDFIKRMDNKQKYPLINQLLKEIPGVNKLPALPAFNEFTNYMVDNYSFKISRDDAKKRELSKEEIYQNDAYKKKFNNFIKSWNEIKSEAIKYQCRPEMPVKSLNANDKLIYFLNDNGELLFGMYLAAACQNFIEWQNTFLLPIVEINAFNGILHHYVDNIKKKIPVQDAKFDQILLINDRFQRTNTYTNLKDIIYSFSYRKIFGEDGKINYSDYNSFVYDYDSIEEELGKIILPGVCLFEGESELNFITFWSEGFRGGRSEILSKFYLKYPQKDLNDKEKENVIDYINKMNSEKMERNNIKYDFKEFFGSMQMIIFYLTEKVFTKENDKISLILKNAPPYLKLSDDCRNFFLNEGNQLTSDKLMNLFFFFEHLCFEDLVDTIQNEYKKEIPEDKKKEIIDKLIKNYNNKLYTLKDLGAAVRRFISRYLAGRLQTTDINEDRELSFYLCREDLWEEKIGRDDNLMDEVTKQLGNFKLNVGQAYAFYELIGEQDKKSLILSN